MGGILSYPESGELEFVSIPLAANHASTVYAGIYDNYDEETQDIFSNIKVPSIATNVINLLYLLFSLHSYK